jgi:serine protease DegQ
MRRLWLIFTQAVTLALAVLFVVGTLKPQWLPREGHGLGPVVSMRSAAPGVLPNAEQPLHGLAGAAKLALPAVVSVSAGKGAAAMPTTPPSASSLATGAPRRRWAMAQA